MVCLGKQGGATYFCFNCPFRNGRTHKGIDIICTPGSDVYAPFEGKILRKARPYGNGKSHDTGIKVEGSGGWEGEILNKPL